MPKKTQSEVRHARFQIFSSDVHHRTADLNGSCDAQVMVLVHLVSVLRVLVELVDGHRVLEGVVDEFALWKKGGEEALSTLVFEEGGLPKKNPL